MEDVLSRLIAEVDSLDFDQGDTTTTLKWNINDWLTAKALLVNEPEIFSPLKEASQESDALLDLLSDNAADGNDYEVSMDIHIQGGPESFTPGFRAMADEVVNGVPRNSVLALDGLRKSRERTAGAVNGTSVETTLDCPATRARAAELAARVSQLAQTYADARRSAATELKASLSHRFRDDVIGRDESSVSLKYSYGLAREAGQKDKKAIKDFETGAEPSPDVQSSAKVPAHLVGSNRDEREIAGFTYALMTPEERVSAEGAALLLAVPTTGEVDKVTADKRISFEAEWNRLEDYTFAAALPVALVLPKDDSLTATAGFSLKFTRDGKPVVALPRYELSLSYEDVDSDPTRQSRFLARLIVSANLTVMGQKSEVTTGLVYSNKPEFLAEQEFDRELSANVGLVLKFGSKPPKAEV